VRWRSPVGKGAVSQVEALRKSRKEVSMAMKKKAAKKGKKAVAKKKAPAKKKAAGKKKK
jgi:hypothetical protein